MSVTTPIPPSVRRAPVTEQRRPAEALHSQHARRATDPQARGGKVLFEVPFTSLMGDGDMARLARSLDLVSQLHPKLHGRPAAPGVLRLDHFSGLFLLPGADENAWLLQGRSWRPPDAWTVRSWQLRATLAARELDPAVPFPPSTPTAR